jgi:hypothetical protein
VIGADPIGLEPAAERQGGPPSVGRQGSLAIQAGWAFPLGGAMPKHEEPLHGPLRARRKTRHDSVIITL